MNDEDPYRSVRNTSRQFTGGHPARLAGIGRWLLMCALLLMALGWGVSRVHDGLSVRQVLGTMSAYEMPGSGPAEMIAFARKPYQDSMLALLKPGTQASVIWQACAKPDCTALSLSRALSLVSYALDPATFASHVCDLMQVAPVFDGVRATYAPGRGRESCDLQMTPALQAAIAHEKQAQTHGTLAAGAGLGVLFLLMAAFWYPRRKLAVRGDGAVTR